MLSLRLILFSFLLLYGLATAPPVFAETKVITAEGTYTMGDGETPSFAEAMALHKAKQMAVEQAGTYVESYVSVKNNQLTADEIQAVAGAALEVEVMEKQRTVTGDSIRFYVKIRANVTPQNIDAFVSRLKQKSAEPSFDFVMEYKQLHGDFERLVKELETIKVQFSQAKTEREKKQALAQLAKLEREFQARKLAEKADQSENKEQKIQYLTQAIELDPNYGQAYASRAISFFHQKQYDRAIPDMSEAIRLDTQNLFRGVLHYLRGLMFFESGQYVEAISDLTEFIKYGLGRGYELYLRGRAYLELQQNQLAIADLTRSIQLDPNDPAAYLARGTAYSRLKQRESALADLATAIRLKPQDPENFEAYLMRGIEYFELKQYDKALVDLSETIKLKPQDSRAYRLRGITFGYLSEIEKAKGDLRLACDLKDAHSCSILENLKKRVER